MAGRLFIVGTPIGNLGDITPRALDTLRAASHVFAEDTRRTRALLTHFGVEGKKVLSLHAHSPERVLEVAIEVLESDHDVALVSDAGMPTVSDPGAELVGRARQRGIRIEVVPGPSAVTAAVALSGLVAGPFSFLGFLPRKGGPRRDALGALARASIPTVLFESPKRLQQTLEDLAAACGEDRSIAVCRELTKQFEETLVAPVSEILSQEREWRGEVTLVVAASSGTSEEEPGADIDERIFQLLDQGSSARDIAQTLATELQRTGTRVKRKDLYSRVLLASRMREREAGADFEEDDGTEHEETTE